MKVTFSLRALKDLERLPKSTGKRIIDKMEWFVAQEHPLSFGKPLTDSDFGSHRFRIGDYRVFVDVQRDRISILFVLAVRHRKEAYKL